MDLISRAWSNLAPPGAMSPPDDLTRPPVSDEPSPFIHDISEDDALPVNRVALAALRPLPFSPDQQTSSGSVSISQTCQRQTRKAAKFDADRRLTMT
jgi:hypothetical protein